MSGKINGYLVSCILFTQPILPYFDQQESVDAYVSACCPWLSVYGGEKTDMVPGNDAMMPWKS